MSNTFEILPVGGVLQQYGPVDAEKGFTTKLSTYGALSEMEVDFTFNDLPTTSTQNNLILRIPPHALIVSARLGTVVPFAGGTSYTIGLRQPDGTEIDNDGLLTAVNGALANINAKGKWVVGTGALIGLGIGANPGQIVVTASGTFTAGEGKLVVTYLPLDVQ